MRRIASYFLSVPVAIVLGLLCGVVLQGCNSSSHHGPAPTLDDHGDNLSNATILSPSATINGRIDSTTDVDCFRVWLEKDQTATVDVQASNSVNLNYGASGTSITATKDNSGSADWIPFYIDGGQVGTTYTVSVWITTWSIGTGTSASLLDVTDPNTGTSTRTTAATANALIQWWKVMVNEDVTLKTFDIYPDEAKTATVSVTQYDSGNNYVASANGYGSADYFQSIAPVTPKGQSLQLTKGDTLYVAVSMDEQGKDHDLVWSYLDNINVERGGMPQTVLVMLSQTVTVEALPDVSHLRMANTIAPVTSGGIGMVTKFKSHNNSSVHTSDIVEVHVRRMTPGDTAPLWLEDDGGFLAALGQDYYWTQPPETVFYIPAGYLSMAPGQDINWRLMVDTASVSTDQLVYEVSGVITANDNGQTLWTSPFLNNGVFTQFVADLTGTFASANFTVTQDTLTTTGPFTGRDVFSADLTSDRDLKVTGAIYRLVSNNGSIQAETHVQFDGVEYATSQHGVNYNVTLPFSLGTPSVQLTAGVAAKLEVPLYLSGAGTGDTVQFELIGLIDENGFVHSVGVNGPSHLIG